MLLSLWLSAGCGAVLFQIRSLSYQISWQGKIGFFANYKKISWTAVPEATESKRSEKRVMDLGPVAGLEHNSAHLRNHHSGHYFDPGMEGVQQNRDHTTASSIISGGRFFVSVACAE